MGTQRADIGDYKRFCLSITNVVFPSLIAEDLVIVKPDFNWIKGVKSTGFYVAIYRKNLLNSGKLSGR